VVERVLHEAHDDLVIRRADNSRVSSADLDTFAANVRSESEVRALKTTVGKLNAPVLA